METITIYPKNEKQKSLLKSLLEEMKIRFEIENKSEKAILSKSEFLTKIDKSILQADAGNVFKLDKNNQKEFLGL
jgi:hypothetical protein